MLLLRTQLKLLKGPVAQVLLVEEEIETQGTEKTRHVEVVHDVLPALLLALANDLPGHLTGRSVLNGDLVENASALEEVRLQKSGILLVLGSLLGAHLELVREGSAGLLVERTQRGSGLELVVLGIARGSVRLLENASRGRQTLNGVVHSALKVLTVDLEARRGRIILSKELKAPQLLATEPQGGEFREV